MPILVNGCSGGSWLSSCFGTNTKGKYFDLALLWVIIASVLLVMMEAWPELETDHGRLFHDLEWGLHDPVLHRIPAAHLQPWAPLTYIFLSGV